MIRCVLRIFQTLLTAIDLKNSDARVIRGITVHNTSDRIETGVGFAAVAASLEALQRFDPRRLGSAQRVLRRIIIAAQPSNVYWRHARACVLSDTKLPTLPSEWTASVIVHESVHARVHLHGIEPRNPELRGRIEALCVQEQINFLERVPGSQPMIDHLRAELAAATWYGENERRQMTIERLRALDAPEWLVRWVESWRFR